MISKKISAVALLLALVTLSIGCFVRASLLGIDYPAIKKNITTDVTNNEAFLKKAFPLSRTLKSMRTKLQYRLGTKEQNGVFITDGRLIENISEPNEAYVSENIAAILEFTAKQSVPTYITLIPTASAILQSDTPKFATIYDQKRFIEDVYKNFAGKLSCIDVYSTLFQNREESLYYNTETLLAPQGGYLVYNVLSKRMGNTPYSLDRFEIEYLEGSFTGSLIGRVDYNDVPPDRIGLYRFVGRDKEFSVTQKGTRDKIYNDLYQEHTQALSGPLSVYFGGLSPLVEIQQRQRSQGNLLLFSDSQAISFLPFLACEHQRITYIDLQKIAAKTLSEIDFGQYDEILFAFSTDTFMHVDSLARIGLYGREES